MSKEILSNTLDRIRALPNGESFPLNPEQVRALESFIAARKDNPDVSDAERSLHARIAGILHQSSALDGDRGADPRVQWILRNAIDKVRQEHWNQTSEAELDQIRSTYDALRVQTDTALDPGKQRLLNLLAEVVEKINAHAAGKKARRTGAGARARKARDLNAFTPDADFWAGPRKHVASLQGIVVDIRVCVLDFEGDTLLVGDVPENVLIVVKDGGIEIRGFVQGHVVASGDITVRGNVQGAFTVSTGGDIRVGRILASASVIAVRGNVTASYAEQADRVFAWKTLTIDGPLSGGVFYGSRIEIAGVATAVELHACDRIHAQAIAAGQGACIYLRNQLTSLDYGKEMSKEALDKHRRVRRLRTIIASCGQAEIHTSRMVQNCYRTAMFYLLGGIPGASQASTFQGMQNRLFYQRKLVTLVERLCEFVENMAGEGGEVDALEVREYSRDCQAELDAIDGEIKSIPAEFGAAHSRYLRGQIKNASRSQQRILDNFVSPRPGSSSALTDLLSRWQRETSETEDEIEAMTERFGIPSELREEMSQGDELTEATIDECRSRLLAGGDNEDIKRANSPLVRILKEYASRHRQQVRSSAVAEAEAELEALMRELDLDSAVLFSTVEGGAGIQAQRFERGVRLSARDPADPESGPVEAETMTLNKDIDSGAGFQRHNNGIRRRA